MEKHKNSYRGGLLVASGLLVVGSYLLGAAENILPIPVKNTEKEMTAWTSSSEKPMVVEALSRTPGHRLASFERNSEILQMPLKGQVLRSPDGNKAMAALNKKPHRVMPDGTNVTAFLGENSINKTSGFYKVPLTPSISLTADYMLPSTLDVNALHGGASNADYIVFSYNDGYIVNGEYSGFTAIIDRHTKALLGNKGDYGEYGRWATDMTYDPTTNRFYGCFMNNSGSGWELGYIQITPGSPGTSINNIHKIAPLPVGLNGIACDEAGELWAIRSDNGMLVKINRKSAALTEVAATGVAPEYYGSLTWDNALHILYWTFCYAAGEEVHSALCTVNPENGEVQIINDFNSQTVQLEALGADFAAKDGAPAAATNLQVNISGFDYFGTVSFNAPTSLENGQSASGNLQAQLSVTDASNYVEVLSTTVDTQYGALVSIPVEFEKAGNYTFSVKLLNDEGPSYPVSVTKYVGIDYPSPITEVNMTCENGKLNISWPAVTEPLFGGYFNPDELIYKVIVGYKNANSQSQVIYEGEIDINSLELDVDDTTDLRAYQVSVTPVCSEVAGQPYQTPWTWFGYLTVPFTDPMSSAGAWTTQRIAGANWRSTTEGWVIPYNWGDYNNSWLFSPAIMMQEGEVYNISVRAFSDVVVHTGKLCLGKSPAASAMTTDLCNISVMPKNNVRVEATHTCSESGIYYLGILNNTASDTWTNKPDVTFSHLSVSAVSHDAPGAPEFEVIRDTKGSLNVAINVKAPLKSHGNTDLTDPMTLTVRRGNTILLNEENVAPGTEFNITDEVSREGTYTYTAFATNDVAEGVPVMLTRFIGVGLPIDPAWVNNSEGEVPGTVEVQWAPVNKNTIGLDIDEEAMTYNVINVMQNVYVERGVTGSSYSFTACEPEDQEAVLISVNAETEAGTSSTYGTYSTAGISFVGTPASLPIHDTFAPGVKLSVPWITVNQSSSYDGFQIVDMMEEVGVMDANGDGRALMGFCPYLDGSVALYSGIIEVPEDANAPAFSYAVYNNQYGETNDNENLVTVYLLGDDVDAIIDQYKICDMPFGWNYRKIDLGLLKGKKVHVMIMINTKSYTSYYFDDIYFFDRLDNDLMINTISALPNVKPGTRFDVNVSVVNTGLNSIKAASKAQIALYRGDKEVGSKKVTGLTTLKDKAFTFSDELPLAEAPGAVYTARVVFPDDEEETNNEAQTNVKLILPTLPTPTDISADRNSEGYPTITWTAPDLTPEYNLYISRFESFQGYSLVHLEGFSTFETTGNVKDISNFETAHGFELWYNPNLAFSGNCFLMSVACKDGKAKEDWLVSPELSGRAHEASFYVRTSWGQHENYFVYTSTTGAEKDCFDSTPIYRGRTLSDNWEKITLQIPEGVKYFAIVAKADDTTELTGLMIDDVIYEGMPINASLSLDGYRLYRDRESVDNKAIEDATFTDLNAEKGGHFYRVSALYSGVESAPTDEVYVFSRGDSGHSAVDEIDNADAVVRIEPGRIVVKLDGSANVSLYDYQGVMIYDNMVSDTTETIAVAPGAYVLMIDNSPLRILVK